MNVWAGPSQLSTAGVARVCVCVCVCVRRWRDVCVCGGGGMGVCACVHAWNQHPSCVCVCVRVRRWRDVCVCMCVRAGNQTPFLESWWETTRFSALRIQKARTV